MNPAAAGGRTLSGNPGFHHAEVSFMKILVGYDGSNVAKEALKVARRHARAFGASVDIVTSMETGTEGEQQAIDDAERGLEWAKTLFDDKSIPCKTHLLIRGMSPGEDLVQFAREQQVDEIVVGVKRRSKVEKILMGSTAQYVVLQAHCPVVSVK
jgi:nucleotide-binding universal stress UspA family protein